MSSLNASFDLCESMRAERDSILKAQADKCKVTLHGGKDYTGINESIEKIGKYEISDLKLDFGAMNAITSMRISNCCKVIIYDRGNYQGSSMTLRNDVPFIGPPEFPEQVRSFSIEIDEVCYAAPQARF